MVTCTSLASDVYYGVAVVAEETHSRYYRHHATVDKETCRCQKNPSLQIVWIQTYPDALHHSIRGLNSNRPRWCHRFPSPSLFASSLMIHLLPSTMLRFRADDTCMGIRGISLCTFRVSVSSALCRCRRHIHIGVRLGARMDTAYTGYSPTCNWSPSTRGAVMPKKSSKWERARGLSGPACTAIWEGGSKGELALIWPHLRGIHKQ